MPLGEELSYDGAGRLVEARLPCYHATYGFAALAVVGRWGREEFESGVDDGLGSIAFDSRGNTTRIGGMTMVYDGARNGQASIATLLIDRD